MDDGRRTSRYWKSSAAIWHSGAKKSQYKTNIIGQTQGQFLMSRILVIWRLSPNKRVTLSRRVGSRHVTMSYCILHQSHLFVILYFAPIPSIQSLNEDNEMNILLCHLCARVFRPNWANQSSGHEQCVMTGVQDIGPGSNPWPRICSQCLSSRPQQPASKW